MKAAEVRMTHWFDMIRSVYSVERVDSIVTAKLCVTIPPVTKDTLASWLAGWLAGYLASAISTGLSTFIALALLVVLN